MSDPVIKVENLSKQYRIGTREAGYRTFRETLTDAAKAPFQRLKRALSRERVAGSEDGNSPLHAPRSPLSSRSDDHIWALKDVSFEVKRGEVVGIIGRNGAGKSTLLKILSKITEPTKGRIEMRGRVGSLLEVGTGFHPELTGHENVYLYGAILGMDRWEVTRKFDKIVKFAGLDKFIETPVKRYSSGMYMRLAFSIAAFLEPEILLVDEVLAVGDIDFQKKCIKKIGSIVQEGRTVLFVSHSLQVVSILCSRAILIDKGKIIADGKVNEIINRYLLMGRINSIQSQNLKTADIRRTGTGSSIFERVSLKGANGKEKSVFQVGEIFEVNFECEIIKLIPNQFYQIRIRSATGIPIYHWVDFDGDMDSPIKEGIDKVSVKIDKIRLYPGTYYLSLLACDRYGTAFDFLEDIIQFEVESGSLMPLNRPYYPNLGLIHEIPKWERL